MSGDLVAFVTARLDEREALARAAQPGPWTYEPEGFTVRASRYEVACRRRSTLPSEDPRRDSTPMLDVDGKHIAANDPAHVLREVAAMREVVADAVAVPTITNRRVVRRLAAIWDTHADYRAEWAP